jgi:hypothetical protein
MYSYKILFDGIDIRTEYDNIYYRNSVIRAGAGPGSYRLCSKEKVRAYLNHRRANNCIRPCDMRLPGDGRQFRFNGLETILRELSRKLPLGETMIRIQKSELALDIALSNLNLQERFTEVATPVFNISNIQSGQLAVAWGSAIYQHCRISRWRAEESQWVSIWSLLSYRYGTKRLTFRDSFFLTFRLRFAKYLIVKNGREGGSCEV